MTRTLEIEIVREHPNCPGVVLVRSELLGEHWVYRRELLEDDNTPAHRGIGTVRVLCSLGSLREIVLTDSDLDAGI